MICVFREVSYSNYLFCTAIIKNIYSNLCAEQPKHSATRVLCLIMKNVGAGLQEM